jgi:large subunit ribosomal protein L9
MKVLLRSDVRGLGRRGDIVVVKSGYARNFLLPSGAAMFASDQTEIQAASMRKSRDLLDAQSRAAAEAQKALIESKPVTIEARASANGRLFGSITESDVVNALRTATGISLRGPRQVTSPFRSLFRSGVSSTSRALARRVSQSFGTVENVKLSTAISPRCCSCDPQPISTTVEVL